MRPQGESVARQRCAPGRRQEEEHGEADEGHQKGPYCLPRLNGQSAPRVPIDEAFTRNSGISFQNQTVS